MWTHICPRTICWKDYYFIELSWQPHQKVKWLSSYGLVDLWKLSFMLPNEVFFTVPPVLIEALSFVLCVTIVTRLYKEAVRQWFWAREIFTCHVWRYYRHFVGEGQGCCWIPYMHRIVLYRKIMWFKMLICHSGGILC